MLTGGCLVLGGSADRSCMEFGQQACKSNHYRVLKEDNSGRVRNDINRRSLDMVVGAARFMLRRMGGGSPTLGLKVRLRTLTFGVL